MDPKSEPGHGHSPAAWSAVVVMCSALAVGTIALFLGNWVWVIGSAVASAFGLLLGIVLSALGWGAQGPRYKPKD